MNKQADFLKKLIEGHKMIADAANELLKSMGPPELGLTKEPACAPEITFNILSYEALQGAKLGEYEIAHKTSNLEDKWSSAYNILRSNNATIKDRYYGEGYQYSYWLYGEDKIYRQKTTNKTGS
jgi:hypothetical protein